MTELTNVSFAAFVQSNRFAVIHFWASWNGYDAQMKEFLELHVPAALRNLIAFARVDAGREEHRHLCVELGIKNLPFLALYRDGRLSKTVTGTRPARERCQHEPNDVLQHIFNYLKLM